VVAILEEIIVENKTDDEMMEIMIKRVIETGKPVCITNRPTPKKKWWKFW